MLTLISVRDLLALFLQQGISCHHLEIMFYLQLLNHLQKADSP